MRKTKAKLIMTLSVALLSVFTMGVSTFAWFQAQAEVNIRAVSDECEITVSAPDNLTVTPSIFAYKGNYTYTNGQYINHGHTNSLSAQTIASNFLELNTDALKTSLLNTTLLAPGSKLTFAIRAVGSRAISSASFDLEKYTSVRLTNRHKLNANTTDSGNPPAIDECIQIYTDINATGSYTENSTNMFSFSFSDTYHTQTMDGTGGNVQTTVYDNDYGYTAQTLGSANSLSNQTIYYFFTIKFMDTASTSYRCVEYTAASGSALTLPQNARTDYVLETDYNSGHKYYTLSDGVYTYVSPQPNEATVETQPYSYYTPVQRYFLPSSSGTSNCYAGLSFQINRIELSLF